MGAGGGEAWTQQKPARIDDPPNTHTQNRQKHTTTHTKRAPQLNDKPTSLVLTAKPRSIPLGPLSRYVETYSKDFTTTYWNMRRDIRMGRSTGQMYFTACGTLIFRVHAKGLWGDEVEFVMEVRRPPGGGGVGGGARAGAPEGGWHPGRGLGPGASAMKAARGLFLPDVF